MFSPVVKFWAAVIFAVVACVWLVKNDMRLGNIETVVLEIRADQKQSVSRDTMNGWIDRTEDRLRSQLGTREILLPRLPAREQ